jgi:hypothetical protein
MWLLVTVLVSLPLWADGIPRFEDYPATEKLSTQPVDPVFRLPAERMYRTRIRLGVRDGDGLFGVEKASKTPPKPNFAGAFYAVTWGCGSDGCAALAIVDGRTGRIYGPPPDASPEDGFIASPRTSYCQGLGLRPDSRLLFVDFAVLEFGPPTCRRSYYEWNGSQYRLVKKVEIKPSK